MKYTYLIICIMFLGLTGCNQKQLYSPLPISTDSLDIVIENTGKVMNDDFSNGFLEGSLDAPLLIQNDNFIIFQSGTTLNYNNMFSITLPTGLMQREYFHLPYHMLSLFSNDSSYKNFAISAGEQILNASSLTAEERCLHSFQEFPQPGSTVTTTSKIIDGHTMYVTQALYPEGSNHIQLCFVDNDITHKILIGNYDLDYAYDIINSFSFLPA